MGLRRAEHLAPARQDSNRQGGGNEHRIMSYDFFSPSHLMFWQLGQDRDDELLDVIVKSLHR